MRLRSLLMPLAVTALSALFLWVIGGRIIALVGTGEPVAIAIGLAIAAVVLVAVFAIVREWIFATRISAMSCEMRDSGSLIEDTLPRSPGGRVERAVADAQFEQLRQVVEQDEDNWESWYNLAFAYDASGDRKRARAALRRAESLRRTQRPSR
ncbi:tetratricopeptide repeat protein [Timonella senegalensis]|uniref:tetratricopeptide repeat protein n=1 Tax=Timonella senegalensis TaxID=1465825 RepID=UPI00030566C3|nr:tetratricopeptide repeat protein [Timonella senegalensis]